MRALRAASGLAPVSGVDALGALLDAGSSPALREAVKETLAAIGVAAAAARCGSTPETFRDLVYRKREPGHGARARLALVVGWKV